MGYNHEVGAFTPDPHEILDAQRFLAVQELKPQDVYHIELEHIIAVAKFDPASNRVKTTPYIYRYASLLKDEHVSELIVESWEAEEPAAEFVRIVGLNEGVLLDSQHMDYRDWHKAPNRFNQIMTHMYEARPQDYIPAIFWVFNSDELEVIDPALSNNNLLLDPNQFADIWSRAEEIFDERCEEAGIDDAEDDIDQP